jgi:hypothetical protein
MIKCMLHAEADLKKRMAKTGRTLQGIFSLKTSLISPHVLTKRPPHALASAASADKREFSL